MTRMFQSPIILLLLYDVTRKFIMTSPNNTYVRFILDHIVCVDVPIFYDVLSKLTNLFILDSFRCVIKDLFRQQND